MDEHVKSDESQFEALRKDILGLGDRLGRRMDEMGKRLQAQIDGFTRDKLRAEGKAEGLAEAAKVAARPSWWVPYARWAMALLVTGAVGLIVMLVTTLWNLEQEKITALQNQPSA